MRVNWHRYRDELAILAVAGFVLLTGNRSFFAHLAGAYPAATGNWAPLLLVGSLAFVLLALLLSLLAWGRLTKPVLTATLALSALCAAFMDGYGIVIDSEMLRNVAQTDWREAGDLLTVRLCAYALLLGVLPACWLWRRPLAARGWSDALMARMKLLGLLLLLAAAMFISAGDLLASFVRSHKAVRSYANPTYPLYALVKVGKRAWPAGQTDLSLIPAAIAADARLAPHDKTRDLLFIVVGETARADHFGINGYARDTTPELRRAGAISLADVSSCGTSTAYSVPCMFSHRGRAEFDPDSAAGEENLLDVLQRASTHVLWLDNNSDSKGVAERVTYVDFRTPANNPVCDEECRDEGMLADLQRRIDAWPDGDIVVVLHQMGNHGPAYYKRYPPAFARFGPECRNKDLSRCRREEIVNAYDNAIAYTDHFLGRAIALLRGNEANFETALIYMSDHGESLGENGVWLHGMPRALAPRAQVHVPAVLWFGESPRRAKLLKLGERRQQAYSHDNLFHTVLGFLDIETEAYRRELDLLAQNTPTQAAP